MSLKNNDHFDICCDEGVVIEVVRANKEWIVRVHGIYWHARTRGGANFNSGDIIRVVGRNGVKLVIEPE